jgi:glycosyltransferase involved in cell wall biosynthesis
MKPRVSVVIPTHNRRALLEDTIASVHAQRGVNVELIVVDDASTDDTWEWLTRQKNLVPIRQEKNARESQARNTGFAAATAPYVMFFDDDDLLEPGALAHLHAELLKEPDAVAAVGARWDWFTDEGWGRRDVHPRIRRVRNVFYDFLFGWSAIPGQCLFRSDAVRAVGGYDPGISYVADRDMCLRVARKGPAVLVPRIVMKYRISRHQFRPADIVDQREYVAQKAIASLPPHEQRRAARIRRAGVGVNTADERARAREFVSAARSLAIALASSPRIFANPLIASWVFQRMARATLRAFVEPRYRTPVRKATTIDRDI